MRLPFSKKPSEPEPERAESANPLPVRMPGFPTLPCIFCGQQTAFTVCLNCTLNSKGATNGFHQPANQNARIPASGGAVGSTPAAGASTSGHTGSLACTCPVCRPSLGAGAGLGMAKATTAGMQPYGIGTGVGKCSDCGWAFSVVHNSGITTYTHMCWMTGHSWTWNLSGGIITKVDVNYANGQTFVFGRGGLIPYPSLVPVNVPLRTASTNTMRALMGFPPSTAAPTCEKCSLPLDGEKPCQHCNPEVVSGYAIGFRAWVVRDGKLGPANDWAPWEPGENVAVCNRNVPPTGSWGYAIGNDGKPLAGTPIDHPMATCRCGYHAQWRPSWLRVQGHLFVKDATHILGAIKAWGRIVEHGDEGFRAEKAQVLALLDNCDEASKLAEVYGVPCLGHRQLVRYAGEFGEVRS